MAVEKSSTFNTFSFLIGFIGIIIGILIGLGAAQLLPEKAINSSPLVNLDKTTEDPIFTSQFATINGKITQIDENTLTVQSGNNISKFNLNKPIFISKPSTLARPASPSGDVRTVPLNEFATLNLQMTGGEYKVTSISLLPPSGSPAPIPSDFPLSSPPAP